MELPGQWRGSINKRPQGVEVHSAEEVRGLKVKPISMDCDRHTRTSASDQELPRARNECYKNHSPVVGQLAQWARAREGKETERETERESTCESGRASLW